MMSSNANIFRVTGPLWGESTGEWWKLLQNVDASIQENCAACGPFSANALPEAVVAYCQGDLVNKCQREGN